VQKWAKKECGGGDDDADEKAAEKEAAKAEGKENKENEPDSDKDLPGGSRIGGNTQTGQNPLGL